jgi:ribonuclease G
MRKIYIDCLSKYYRIALLEDGKLQEIVYTEKDEKASVGDIFVGKIEKVLPSKIAFVNIGEEYPVFLQLTDNKEKNNTFKAKPGQDIIVQIEKEAYNEKRAVATTCVSISGKYSVVVFDNSGIGVSKKITDNDRREALRKIAEPYNVDGYSIILRTNCENTPNDEIEEEISVNLKKLKDIKNKGVYTKAPALLYKDVSVEEKTLRDLYSSEEDLIIVNDRKVYDNILKNGMNVEYYEDNIPMFHNYLIESQIDKLFSKKVWLKSGGYLIIDETEAMTVIDVNSGKAVSQESFIKTNKEAAEEVARQIRLRNISGMIIVDFINTKGENDAQNLSNLLRNYISKDRVKTRIIGMTELGLMQLTRQKIRKSLSKYILCECPYCKGSGKIFLPEMIAEKIKTEIINVFTNTIYNKVTVSSNATIIKSLKAIFSMSNKYKDNITFNTIETSKADYYLIEKFKK